MATGVVPESAPAASRCCLTAEPIDIAWNASLPVFAKEEFLRAVGDEYGWLGGTDASGTLRCILPFTIVRKAAMRLVRFRVQTIPIGSGLDVFEEKTFLNSVVRYFRRTGADVIIPGSNNAIFRTYPDDAQAAPYGSYVVDLAQPEDALWAHISKTTRQNINAAKKDGVVIREGAGSLEPAYDLIRETFGRSKMGFMSREAFRRFVAGLGEHGKVMAAEYQGETQSYSLFAFSAPCAYWIYGGNASHHHQGATKLLLWEAIRLFRSLGVRQFDFFGARIDPPKGTKQEAINLMKKRFGATLSEGYMWRYPLRSWRARAYSIAVRLLRGGDIVDQEGRKLNPSAHSTC